MYILYILNHKPLPILYSSWFKVEKKNQNNKPVQLDILKTNKTIGKDDKIHLLIYYALCVYYIIGQSLFVWCV